MKFRLVVWRIEQEAMSLRRYFTILLAIFLVAVAVSTHLNVVCRHFISSYVAVSRPSCLLEFYPANRAFNSASQLSVCTLDICQTEILAVGSCCYQTLLNIFANVPPLQAIDQTPRALSTSAN